MKKLLKKQGFTLVELIIVIAIIAVLAVAAFMMLTKWLGKSRDSRRLGDLKTIQTGLEVGYADVDMGNGLYPDISSQDGVVLLYSGTDTSKLAYQGVVNQDVASQANLQKVPLDPSDQNEYTYLVTANRKKFQLLAMLEDGSETTAFLNPVYALDYSNRVPTVRGFDVGILLEKDTNLPVQYSTNELTGLNLSDSDLLVSYVAKVKEGEEAVSGTGIQELELYTQKPVTISPIVDETPEEETPPEIITYTVSGSFGVNGNGAVINVCGTDVTADVSGDFSTTIDEGTDCSNIYATSSDYVCTTTTNGPVNLASDVTNIQGNCTPSYASCTAAGEIKTAVSKYGSCDTNDFVVCSGVGAGYIISACNVGTNISSSDSTSAGELFQWGNNADIRTATTSTTRVAVSNIDSTYSNSVFIISSLNWNTIQNDNLWGNTTDTNVSRKGPCVEGYHVPTVDEWNGLITSGGWTSVSTMMSDINLPYTGVRDGTAGSINNSTSGYYWSSSTSGSDAYDFDFYGSSTIRTRAMSRTHGMGIRCFKN